MSSKWTSKYAILRDLSQAQGWVPATLDCAVEANQKPPVPIIEEKTEEEFYRDFIGDGKVNVTPDLGLIKQMLEVVHGEDNEADSAASIIEIAKLNPHNLEIALQIPTVTAPVEENNNTVDLKGHKTKSQRNVALASILNTNIEITDKKSKRKNKNIGIEKFVQKPGTDNLMVGQKQANGNKLSKSSFLPSVQISIQSKGELEVQLKPRTLNFDYKNMFKKKSVTEPVLVAKKKIVKHVKQPNLGTPQYVPTEWADDYYKTMIERVNLREEVSDDIWSRASKKMKEIDERRREELVLLEFQKSMSESGTTATDTSTETNSPATTTEDTQSQSSDITSEVTETEICDENSKICGEIQSDEVNVSDSNESIEDQNNGTNPDIIKREGILQSSTVEELVQMEAKKLDIVRLPLYRHLLTGECAVCLAQDRYRAYLKGAKDENPITIIKESAEEKTEHSSLNPLCEEFTPRGFYLDDVPMDDMI